jgi:DNA-binding IclR family transcriptional regulator
MSPTHRDGMAAAGDDGGTLSRAAALLDAFDEGHRRLSLAALVYRSGLARSTVHRTAAKMIELGWLQRHEGRYMVGEHLFELASLAPSRYELRDAVLPYMQDLHEATRLTVQLGILEGVDVVLAEKISGHREVGFLAHTGGRVPAYASSLGRAMLAHSDAVIVDAVVEAGMPARTRFTITSPELLRTELVAVAERGWAVDREEGNIGVSCVGVPVFGLASTVVAALSVTGPSGLIRPDQHGPALRIAGAAASRAVGARRRRPYVSTVSPPLIPDT